MHDVYSEHHGWVFGWLRKKLGCAHNAADVAQDTFLRILSSRDALLQASQSRGYIATTARNLLIDRARRQRLEKAYLEELALLALEHPGAPSAERIWETLDALEQICRLLDGLGSKPREAFLLHYLEGQPQAQVAEHLGISVRMVQKYLVQVLLHCQTLRDPS
ncbi:sigma-70 family RNA polymerase sigma factor [Pseudomonas tructae]|uniref:Sigma-70 family RNA polymerase sigma factor n=1 Tax=Pseudomonas tructae TaxID=2518644 RepID=A0A411MQP0_9PSED|nr:sigma-70 family RNA polymerase sigma factor [Pseudomonas tructae]QBF29081.1 sigma-70 family RNA polymerase sigma factor [Pseudomonas tructae]